MAQRQGKSGLPLAAPS
jgi:chromosome segregation ATPase